MDGDELGREVARLRAEGRARARFAVLRQSLPEATAATAAECVAGAREPLRRFDCGGSTPCGADRGRTRSRCGGPRGRPAAAARSRAGGSAAPPRAARTPRRRPLGAGPSIAGGGEVAASPGDAATDAHRRAARGGTTVHTRRRLRG